MSKNYDLIIIGNGAAAFAASIKASELSENNFNILMVGSGKIGGTCVNVGCVPSKFLLEASNKFYYSRKQKYAGIEIKEAKLDFKKVMEDLRSFVAELRKKKYIDILKEYPNIEYIEGKAKFKSEKEIEVDGKNFRAKYFIIATGSKPSIPKIEGLEDVGYLTSDSIWEISKLPKNIAVIGGGAIGLEIGQALLHFGSDVKILEALDRIIPNAEPELSYSLQKSLKEEGMEFFMKVRISKVRKFNENKLIEIITADGKKEIEVEEILVATGRKPNTSDLGLEKVKVELDERGFIKTDSTMKTSNPRIYAAGDCVSKKLMLETLAAKEGTVAASNILGVKSEIDYISAPWVVFTYPQLSSVGYNEREFVETYGRCSCKIIKLENVPKALILKEEKGLIKIVIDSKDNRIVGVHALSPNSSEFIIEGALAIKYGLSVEEIIDTVHAFPTLAEGIKIGAQAFIRDVSKMSCCVE